MGIRHLGVGSIGSSCAEDHKDAIEEERRVV
jgi:hypothetical protein